MLVGLSALFPPIFVAAQYEPDIAPAPMIGGPISSPQQAINLINRILYWFATAFWIFAAGFVFYAAYLYLTAAGDVERVKKAHKQLLWAIVAIAVGLMAYGLPLLIHNIIIAGAGFGICIPFTSICF